MNSEVEKEADTKTEQPFHVHLISENSGLVTARAGYQVMTDHSIESHPNLDVLIVVGGVHTEEMTKPKVIQWIAGQSQSVDTIASVCTGAFLLAQAKVITDHTVTTHWEDISDLRNHFPDLKVIEDIRWVDEGRIITSAGISAGIDMSLHLVSKLHSVELAVQTAKQMDFDWAKNSD
jgi:transcriptional regulator GlxA family with amidase domain